MKIMRKFVRFLKIIWGSIVSILLVGFRSKRAIYYASRWGMVEHRFGRLTGLAIALSFLVEYFQSGRKFNLLLCLIGASFFCWLVYLVSHTMEKKLYGGGLRRGGYTRSG